MLCESQRPAHTHIPAHICGASNAWMSLSGGAFQRFRIGEAVSGVMYKFPRQDSQHFHRLISIGILDSKTFVSTSETAISESTVAVSPQASELRSGMGGFGFWKLVFR